MLGLFVCSTQTPLLTMPTRGQQHTRKATDPQSCRGATAGSGQDEADIRQAHPACCYCWHTFAVNTQATGYSYRHQQQILSGRSCCACTLLHVCHMHSFQDANESSRSCDCGQVAAAARAGNAQTGSQSTTPAGLPQGWSGSAVHQVGVSPTAGAAASLTRLVLHWQQTWKHTASSRTG